MPREKENNRGTKAAITLGAAAIPAVLAYLVARRINLTGMSAKQRRVADILRKGDFAVDAGTDVSKMPAWQRRLWFGTDAVFEDASGKLPRRVKAVIAPASDPSTLPQNWRKKILIGNPHSDILGVDDKVKETLFLQQYAPTSVPKSVPIDIESRGSLAVRANQLKKYLRKKLGDNWVLKHKEDFQSASSLIDNKTDLKRLIKKYHKYGTDDVIPSIGLTPAQLKQLDPAAYINAVSRDPDYRRYERLVSILNDPGAGLGQVKEDLVYASPALDRIRGAVNRLAGNSSPSNAPTEYRVHVLGGRVAGTPIPRYLTNPIKNVFDVVSPIERAETRNIRKFVNSTLMSLPEEAREVAMALDVVPTRAGGFKIMEANPRGYSGLLFPSSDKASIINPFRAVTFNRALSDLQGQATPLIAGTHALAAGAAGAALGAGASTFVD